MPSYSENLVRAANDLNSGQLEQAGQRLGRMIGEHPEQAPAYNLRAVLRKAQNELPGALDDARKAAELDPGNVQYLANLGTLQLLQGDPDAALEQFGNAIAKESEFALARRNRGLLLLGLERFPEAVEDLKIAARKEPKRAATRTAYADALVETNALNEALEELRAANAIQDTQTPQWQSVWGRLMYRSGRLPDARDAFTAAILAQPNEIRHYIGLAATHYHEGAAEQARKITHAALKKSPTTQRTDGDPELRVLVLETLGDECFSALPGRAFSHSRGHFVALIPPGRIAYTHAVTDHLDTPASIPDLDRYDLVYNNHAVHETTVQLGLTEQLADLVNGFEQPVINAPAAVAETTRLANAEKFVDAEKFIFPKTVQVSHELDPAPTRAAILEAMQLPLILRPLDTHIGAGAILVETDEQLLSEIARRPYSEFYAIEYHDCQSEDGLYRRYRLICAGDKMTTNSLHIATTWNVHGEDAGKIGWLENGYDREEMTFHEDTANLIGGDPKEIFRDVLDRTALDIYGFDFGFRKDGRLIVFEVNAAMSMGLDNYFMRFPYREPYEERMRSFIESYFFARKVEPGPSAV